MVAAERLFARAWSERASADPHYNAAVRKRILHPLEFPVLGAVVLAIVIYSFSRIMLFLSKETGPAVFGIIAALILLGGLGLAIPIFTTQQTRDVATLGDLKLQATESQSYVVPPLVAGGALVLGVVQGVRVLSVGSGPIATSGLKPDDVITKIDMSTVRSPQERHRT